VVVEAGQPALVLGDQLRLEGGLPVARNVQFQLAVGRDDGLCTAAVAVIAALALLGLAGQMVRATWPKWSRRNSGTSGRWIRIWAVFRRFSQKPLISS
jgi:hypothetical protein